MPCSRGQRSWEVKFRGGKAKTVLASFSKFQQNLLSIFAAAKTVAKTLLILLKLHHVLPKTGAKTNFLRCFLEAQSESFSISFSRDYRKSFSIGDAQTNFCASFSELLLKPELKPWVLKLFRHVSKTSFSASFSQLLLKPVLIPWY